MDSILIQRQFPHRVSLSQAAEISGYHQDYLGQLCRLGKIRAAKIGRNWYTTQTELKVLLSGDTAQEDPNDILQEASLSTQADMDIQVQSQEAEAQESERAVPIAPVIVDNYVISQVDGMPIKLRARNYEGSQHNVQTLITRMKLEGLRNEVLQISQFVENINEQLSRHEEILNKLQAQAQNQNVLRNDLRENFVPSLTVSPVTKIKPESLITVIDRDVVPDEQLKEWVWLWPAVAVMMLVIPVGLLILLPKSEGPAVASTTYYQSEVAEVNPQVAGETEIITQP